MKSEAFVHYQDVPLTLIGLALFMAIFVGSVIWTGLRANRSKYLKMAEAPLHDEDGAVPGGRG